MLRRATLLLSCVVLPGAATAQASLAEQIATAVKGEDWDQQVSKFGFHQRSVAELVDALASVRGTLRGHLWSRALSLVTQRQNDVDALWRSCTSCSPRRQRRQSR